MNVGEKRCRICGEVKSLFDFYKNKGNKDGYLNICKTCDYESLKPRRKRYRDKETPEQRQAWMLKYNFGITVEQYNALFEKQGGLCGICHQPETKRYGRMGIVKLCVDHDHETGVIRGLLCCRCNTALGYFLDAPERMQQAIEYLHHAAERDPEEVIMARKGPVPAPKNLAQLQQKYRRKKKRQARQLVAPDIIQPFLFDAG